MSKGPIPRVFHRIWLGGPMPPEFEAYGESWRRLHPGWRHVLWTEQNLPKLINQKEFDGARALAQKADIARYEILYEQGGVYVDCDFECFRPIDELLEGVHCFAATEDLTWVSIGILGAVPKHSLVRAVIDEIPRSVASQHDAPVNIQTGPLLFTRVVAARRMRLERDDLVVFPPKIFYPYRFGQKRPPREQMPEAYGAHHWAASWMKAQGGRVQTGTAGAPAGKGPETAGSPQDGGPIASTGGASARPGVDGVPANQVDRNVPSAGGVQVRSVREIGAAPVIKPPPSAPPAQGIGEVSAGGGQPSMPAARISEPARSVGAGAGGASRSGSPQPGVATPVLGSTVACPIIPAPGPSAGAGDTQPGFGTAVVHAAAAVAMAASALAVKGTTVVVGAQGAGNGSGSPVKGTLVTIGQAAGTGQGGGAKAVETAPALGAQEASALPAGLAGAVGGSAEIAGVSAVAMQAASSLGGSSLGLPSGDPKDDLRQPEKFRILAALDPDKPDPVLLLLVAFGRLFRAGERVELGIYAYSEPSLPLLHCVQQLLGVIIGDLTKTAELSLLSRVELGVLPYQVAFVPSGNAVEDARALFDAVHGLWLIRQTLDAWRDAKSGPSMPPPMRRDLLVRRAAKRPGPEAVSMEQPLAARAAPLQGLRGTYIGEDRVLIHTVYGRPVIAAARDRSITPELMLSGCYDQPLFRFLSSRLTPGDIAFDIGANIGFFTVLMGTLVGPEGHVVAYEASPAPFALLIENVTMNYMNDRVTAAPLAAWSEAKRLTFHASERFCGNGSVRAKDDAYRQMYPTDKIRTIEVEAEPLDQRWSKFERIEVVNIDVEGAEFHVFRGMQGLIRAGAIRSVVFECIRSHLGADWQAFLDLLRSLEQEFHVGFSTIASDGKLVPLPLDTLTARGNFTQVVMERKG